MQVVLCATNMVVIKGSEATFDAFAFSLGRFCIAALAFTPFLAEGLADEALWAPAVELGLWMGASLERHIACCGFGAESDRVCSSANYDNRMQDTETAAVGVQAWGISRRRR